MKNSSNLNISCKVVFSLNKWNKKVGSPGSFGRKRSFISLNSSASTENLSRSERVRARARAKHAINDARKGCAMQLNGITLSSRLIIYTVQFTSSLTRDPPPPPQKKNRSLLSSLSNKSQEEVILAHFLMHFKTLCNTKLTRLFRMGLALMMLALNGNLVCGIVTGECLKRPQFTLLLYVLYINRIFLGWARPL